MAIRRSFSRVVFEFANYSFFLLFCFSCLYPFYNILVYSLSAPSEAARGAIYFVPKGFTFQSYIEIFRIGDIGRAAFVSVSRTIAGTVLTVFCTSLFAFVLTQPKMKGRKLVYRALVASMYFNAGLIPSFLLIRSLGLMNSFLVYVIPGAVAAYNVVLVKVYIEQLPVSLQESATMDGAGPFVIYSQIIFPLSIPILATIAIFTAVGQWNSWFDNFLYVRSPKLKTLQYMLYLFVMDIEAREMLAAAERPGQAVTVTAVRMTPKSLRMTVTMVVTLPILLAYPFFQRYFVKGLMIGAIKG